MRILGIIPARGGSKGVPQKNSKLLGEKPLIAYTIASAMEASHLTDVIVSTDSTQIAAIAKTAGAEVPFIRPSHLASDGARSIDVVIHAVQHMAHEDRQYDAICLLQPTVPFRESGSIDKAIDTLIKGKYDSLISVGKVPHQYNPHWVFEQRDGQLCISTGEKEIVTRRQELPDAFYRDGSIYLVDTATLLVKESFYGERLGHLVSNVAYNINIDTPEDWERAEQFLKKN